MQTIRPADIYKKAKAWVLANYKNPDKVLKEDISNERIRVSAYAREAWFTKAIGVKVNFNADYDFAIDIKDGKAQLTYTPTMFYSAESKPLAYNYEAFYKDGTVRKMYKDSEIALETTMNDLLSNFIASLTAKKADW